MANDFIEQVEFDQAPGCGGHKQRESRGPEKAALEGSNQSSNKRKLQPICFAVVDIIIWNFKAEFTFNQVKGTSDLV